MAGAQDNGCSLLKNNTWTHVTGGDGMECIIDHDNKLIYIAIPKTGTTSTQAFLQKIISDNSIVVNSNKPNNIGLCKHSSAKTISSIIENYSDYHSIAVIRNPYDWYVSWFTYRQRNGAGISSKNMSMPPLV